MLKNFSVLFALVCFFLNVKSQSDEDKIRSIIRSFNADITKLTEEGAAGANAVISYVSPNFVFDRKVINIFNVINHETMDFKTSSFMLRQMRASNLTNKRVLGNLDDISVRNNVAYARYSNNYELYETDRLINQGKQYINLIFRKNSGGDWKIEWMDVISIDDLTYKSTCICEIYENEGLKNIITQTIVPDGSEADILEDKFYIDDKVEPKVVRFGFKEYMWSSAGAINKRNIDGSQGDQVGIAKSRQELLLTLLKKEIYPDRCDNVVRKLK